MLKNAVQGLSPAISAQALECIHVPVKTSHGPSCVSTALCSGGTVTVPRCKRSSSMTGSTSVSTAALLHATTIVISNMTALLLRKHLPGSLHVSLRFTCLQNCFLWACSVRVNAFLLMGCIYNSRKGWHSVHASLVTWPGSQYTPPAAVQLYESRLQHLHHQYRV